jgi:hypothetical protein
MARQSLRQTINRRIITMADVDDVRALFKALERELEAVIQNSAQTAANNAAQEIAAGRCPLGYGMRSIRKIETVNGLPFIQPIQIEYYKAEEK